MWLTWKKFEIDDALCGDTYQICQQSRFGGYYKTELFLYCTNPELKPKYSNIIAPYNSTMWAIVLGSFILTGSVASAVMVLQKYVTQDEDYRVDISYTWLHLTGIVFAEYNFRYRVLIKNCVFPIHCNSSPECRKATHLK